MDQPDPSQTSVTENVTIEIAALKSRMDILEREIAALSQKVGASNSSDNTDVLEQAIAALSQKVGASNSSDNICEGAGEESAEQLMNEVLLKKLCGRTASPIERQLRQLQMQRMFQSCEQPILPNSNNNRYLLVLMRRPFVPS
jgi:hypothetical protein